VTSWGAGGLVKGQATNAYPGASRRVALRGACADPRVHGAILAPGLWKPSRGGRSLRLRIEIAGAGDHPPQLPGGIRPQCESPFRNPEPLVSTLPAPATAAAKPVAAKPATRKLRRWYYVAGFTLIVAASAVVGLLVVPRTAAPVVLTSEPVRPLPSSASPGTTSGLTPAPAGAPPVPPASKTQTQNVVLATILFT
jgi:hypothetical protein